MAELNNSAGSLRGKGRTSTVSPRVDMTPMVDLMFLLITFFMLTTTLSEPSAMNIAMPVDGAPGGEISEKRTLNLCLDKENKIDWYMGSAKAPLSTVNQTGYGKLGLRKVLKEQNSKVIHETGDASKGVIVLVKPGDRSSYQNLVDVLDELKITGIEKYIIVDTEAEDVQRMSARAVY